MAHPESCQDPNCQLSYVDHLRRIGYGSAAFPTRKPETAQASTREKRWERDHAAYERLTKQGLEPPQLDGARARERHAENEWDITHGEVKIDYDDPT